MNETTDFAHGILYGDTSGVIFYGPPENGFWLDCLDISDRYRHPIFYAFLDRWRENPEELPVLVSEWNMMTGWAATGAGVVLVPPQTAQEFASVLDVLTEADLAPHAAGATPTECLRCAEVIRQFIYTRLTANKDIYIEDD